MPAASLARLAAIAIALAVLALPMPAAAHKQGMRFSVGPVFGNTSPIQIRKAGSLGLSPFGGGTLDLSLKDVRDANGVKMDAPGNELRLDLRVNGVPTSVTFPFDIKKGRGTLKTVVTPSEQLYKGDLIEYLDAGLYDSNGTHFGVVGVPPGTRTPILRSGLIYIVDSTSPIHFSRGGDTRLKLRGNGNFNTGFDTLLDSLGERITIPQVKVELEIVLNGGPPEVRSYTYDIVRGRSVPKGRPHVELGFLMTDSVEVRRLDVFDYLGNRFATLGVKIVSPRMR